VTDSAEGAYLADHVRERLVADERVGEQDLHVDVVAGTLVITGAVTTEARRAAVADVAKEVLGDASFRNHVTVVHADGPVETEHLPS
jgi:osmotically-inducible protein OsmY